MEYLWWIYMGDVENCKGNENFLSVEKFLVVIIRYNYKSWYKWVVMKWFILFFFGWLEVNWV